MKNTLIFILTLFILSCDKIPGVSDYTGVPNSSKISEEQGLLIAKYKASQNEVIVDGNKYIIVDSWTTYRFKTKKNKTINKQSYDFLFSLKNVKTGKLITELTSTSFLNKSVRYSGKDYGYANGIGIESGLLSIQFQKNKKPISPEIIMIEFQNGENSQVINFVKSNKASH